MNRSLQKFINVASSSLSKFCYVVWDYFKFPKLTVVKIQDESIFVVYENHLFFSGYPNEDLLSEIKLRGNMSLSFDRTWLDTLKKYFCDFSPVTVPAKSWYNNFLCMELTKEEFRNPLKDFKSIILTDEHLDYLSIKRQVHYSFGPGVGVIVNNSLIACAFAPHILNNDRFSYAVIRDVWTEAKWRGRGLGTDVTAHLCKTLFGMGLKKIFLWVEKSNKAAIRVYEKLGFKVKNEILGAFATAKN